MGLSRDRKGNKKEGELNKWIKTLLSGIIGAVLSAVILWLAVILQIRTQYQQNYDLNVANMVVKVLLARDTSLHPLLSKLLASVKDDMLRSTLAKRVVGNPWVPDPIRKEIETKFQVESSIGISDELTVQVLRHPKNVQRSVEIMFVWDDTKSLGLAQKIESALWGEGITPKLVPVLKEWYYEDRWVPETVLPEVRFNNSNKEYAQEIKEIIDSKPELDEFRMNKTTTGTPPYSVLIILPDQTK